MNKTRIEWADYTWNPITGCLHGCAYCYARRTARRFCTNEHGKEGLLAPCDGNCPVCSYMDGLEFVGDRMRVARKGGGPYPYGFFPTYHPHKLGEPAEKTKGVTIFVGSMTDLFGKWVPDERIAAVFAACKAAPQHTYLFLTKNPGRYMELAAAGKLRRPVPLYGSTTPTQDAHSGGASTTTPSDPLSRCRTFDEVVADAVKKVGWIIMGA
jgi:protein gp37